VPRLVGVRVSKFWELMNDEFGEAYASTLARQHHVRALGDRTVLEAIDAGEPPRRVWLALCDDMDVPESRRLGADRTPPR
jgi:Protein of unknown function (DUF3046)